MDEDKEQKRGRPRLVEVEMLRNYQPQDGDKLRRGETCKLSDKEASDLAKKGIAKKL